MSGLKRLMMGAGLIGVLLLPLPATAVATVTPPIDGYFERQGIKGFGTLADAAFHEQHRALFPNNGFANQFTGYHAGVDVEYTAPDDLNRDVPVRAITDGEVIYAGDVIGYGGVIVIRHQTPEAVTSLYGHIRLRDRQVNVGDRVTAGQTLAMLGAQFTAETSGARKHLHFAIHRGPNLSLAGHEQTVERLQAEWYNPNDWLARYLPTPQPSPTVQAQPPASPPHRNLFQQFFDWLAKLFT